MKYTLAGLFLAGMLVLIGLTKTDRVNEPSQVPAGKALSEQRSTKKDNTALSINATMGEGILIPIEENRGPLLREAVP